MSNAYPHRRWSTTAFCDVTTEDPALGVRDFITQNGRIGYYLPPMDEVVYSGSIPAFPMKRAADLPGVRPCPSWREPLPSELPGGS